MSDTYQGTAENTNLTTGAGGGPTLEKDFENGQGGSYHEHLHDGIDHETALRKVQTAGSISISPELFEKIYLSPQNRVAGDLRKTFGNPTPFALVGFLLSLSPLSCDLMGWRGAGNDGASDIGMYISFGGIMMFLGGIGEFILGNNFPMLVFGSFGAFWLSFGLTLYPYMGSFADYDNMPGPTGSPVANGLHTIGFNASLAFWLLFMGVLCLLYTILSIRTNLIFFIILILLPPSFGCLSAGFWYMAEGKDAYAAKLILVAGALTFVIDWLGWYLVLAIMMAAMDFPISLPVFDLSHIIKGASDKRKSDKHDSPA